MLRLCKIVRSLPIYTEFPTSLPRKDPCYTVVTLIRSLTARQAVPRKTLEPAQFSHGSWSSSFAVGRDSGSQVKALLMNRKNSWFCGLPSLASKFSNVLSSGIDTNPPHFPSSG